MKRKLFSLTVLLLGAFILFFPQNSQAVYCECSIIINDYPIGLGCKNQTPFGGLLTGAPPSAKTCDEYKTSIINGGGGERSIFEEGYDRIFGNNNESESMIFNQDNLLCIAYTDPQCTAPLEVEDTSPNTPWYQPDLTPKPTLEIDIPGLNLSKVVSTSDETGTYYYIPWIPELISALYNFSIGVVSIVAVIIIIIQGIRIVTSAGGEGKSTAYKKIGQAIIGLFIAWGSFAILYNINPATTEFNALKVKIVTPQNLPDFEDMKNSTDETISPEDANEVVNDTPRFPNCPITLDNSLEAKAAGNSNKEARTVEFYEKIVLSGVINGTTQADRIMQVGDAATKCGVRFGSCGRTAGTIWVLAGVPAHKYYDDKYIKVKGKRVLNPHHRPENNPRNLTRDCLKLNDGCWPQEDNETIDVFNWPGTANTLSRSQTSCEEICKDKTKKKECTAARSASTKTVMQALVSKLTESKLEDELNKLKAGDLFWIYNANGGVCRGNHAMLFDKWLSDGRAQVIQGQNPPKGALDMSKKYQNGQVDYGAVCIKEACASKFIRKPVSRIFRAK